MRRPRVKAPDGHAAAYYHCVSRVVGREFLLGEAEKEQFVRYMRLYAKHKKNIKMPDPKHKNA